MTIAGVSEVHATLPLAGTLAAVRGASGPVVIVLLHHDWSAVERAMLIAAIGPLAIELAPVRRLSLLDIAPDAAADDIDAAKRFLARAGSTTGQVLAIA